jgi:hypothetical protein
MFHITSSFPTVHELFIESVEVFQMLEEGRLLKTTRLHEFVYLIHNYGFLARNIVNKLQYVASQYIA